MDDKERLNIILSLFKEQEYPCRIVDESDSIPYPHLEIGLNVDSKGREQNIEITCEEQLIDQGLSVPEDEGNPILRLVFQMPLPFTIDPMTAREVGTLLHFINREIDLPGFELAEVDDKVFYRHVLLTREAGIDATVIFSIIGLALYYTEWFSGVIEEIANGTMTFNEVLEKVLETAEEMRS